MPDNLPNLKKAFVSFSYNSNRFGNENITKQIHEIQVRLNAKSFDTFAHNKETPQLIAQTDPWVKDVFQSRLAPSILNFFCIDTGCVKTTTNPEGAIGAVIEFGAAIFAHTYLNVPLVGYVLDENSKSEQNPPWNILNEWKQYQPKFLDAAIEQTQGMLSVSHELDLPRPHSQLPHPQLDLATLRWLATLRKYFSSSAICFKDLGTDKPQIVLWFTEGSNVDRNKLSQFKQGSSQLQDFDEIGLNESLAVAFSKFAKEKLPSYEGFRQAYADLFPTPQSFEVVETNERKMGHWPAEITIPSTSQYDDGKIERRSHLMQFRSILESEELPILVLGPSLFRNEANFHDSEFTPTSWQSITSALSTFEKNERGEVKRFVSDIGVDLIHQFRNETNRLSEIHLRLALQMLSQSFSRSDSHRRLLKAVFAEACRIESSTRQPHVAVIEKLLKLPFRVILSLSSSPSVETVLRKANPRSDWRTMRYRDPEWNSAQPIQSIRNAFDGDSNSPPLLLYLHGAGSTDSIDVSGRLLTCESEIRLAYQNKSVSQLLHYIWAGMPVFYFGFRKDTEWFDIVVNETLEWRGQSPHKPQSTAVLWGTQTTKGKNLDPHIEGHFRERFNITACLVDDSIESAQMFSDIVVPDFATPIAHRRELNEIKIGIVPTSSTPSVKAIKTVLEEHLFKATNMATVLEDNLSDYDSVVQALISGRIQLAYLGWNAYKTIGNHSDLEVVSCRKGPGGKDNLTYKCLLIGATGGEMQGGASVKEFMEQLVALRDLHPESRERAELASRKITIAFTDDVSTSGFIEPTKFLKKLGIGLHDWGGVEFLRSHNEALSAMFQGQPETVFGRNGALIATDGDQLYKYALKRHLEGNSIDWRNYSGILVKRCPQYPWVVSRCVNSETKKAIQTSLCSINDAETSMDGSGGTKILDFFGGKGFVTCSREALVDAESEVARDSKHEIDLAREFDFKEPG